MNKEISNIIAEFKKKIKKIYGRRLCDILLYGSWARGIASEHSDIDLLIVLKGKVNPGIEIDKIIDIITDINLKNNVLLSVLPVSETNWRKKLWA